MAIAMTELLNLTAEEQKYILKRISKDIYTPIDIDGQVYYIPSAVNELIERLFEKTVSLKTQLEDGLPNNTE
tara:strand:- start:18434 stop:18649 length:216 start_codon:yes stop_codon:yes gene_type:complete